MPFLQLCAFLCDFGMLESMLESHMKANGAVASDVGMAFTIFGAFYAGGNCLVGVVSIIKYLLSAISNAVEGLGKI